MVNEEWTVKLDMSDICDVLQPLTDRLNYLEYVFNRATANPLVARYLQSINNDYRIQTGLAIPPEYNVDNNK